MPRMPYWPPGTLAEAMCYPQKRGTFGKIQLACSPEATEARSGGAAVGQERGWEQQLSEEELTGLAFARVLLHKPQWVLMDEVLDNLDADTLALITDVIGKELKDSAVIHIGRQMANDPTFERAGASDQGSDGPALATQRRRASENQTAGRRRSQRRPDALM